MDLDVADLFQHVNQKGLSILFVIFRVQLFGLVHQEGLNHFRGANIRCLDVLHLAECLLQSLQHGHTGADVMLSLRILHVDRIRCDLNAIVTHILEYQFLDLLADSL